ncbi:MAG: glycerophosphodiester phosphodiesterase family protein [Planktothrix sp. GU0601_MAG3]|nr:MAG: glycerophosphodiester phosphodiesterase family protein [Planktothrix sp. GU0601_MAG3]
MDLEIIAHRGFSVMAPENTLVAFSAALQQGANSLEFDLQVSADGIPVIFHDQELNRITGVSGKISEKTVAELKELDAGSWFAERFAGESIPTLENAIASFQEVKDFLYFDVKPDHQWSDLEIKQLGDLLINNNLINKSIMTSFNQEFLDQIRGYCPEIILGYFLIDFKQFEQQLQTAISKVNAILTVDYSVILEHPEIITQSRNQGVDIVVWTVDDLEDFKKLVNLGVKRIITNSLIGNIEVN